MFPIRVHYPRLHQAVDPLREFNRLGRMLDGCNVPAATDFAVDVSETDKQYLIEANLPGFKRDEVELTIEDGLLTIQAKREQDQERSEGKYHVRERRAGQFSRTFRLPDDVNPDQINAAMSDGVLSVALQKAESALPRKIEVKGA